MNFAALTLAAALALTAVLMLAAAAPTQAVLAHAAGTALEINKQVARRDTRALLGQLRLPSGTARSRGEPAGDGPALLKAPRITAENTVSVSRWWVSSDEPAAVLAYVHAHHPGSRGFLQVMTSPSADVSTLSFLWTIDGPHLFEQELQVSVARLADGQTGIMAQATSRWMVPRSPSERVPAEVHSVIAVLRIGTGPGGMRRQRTRRYMIDGSARVATVVRELDSLPISQPGLVYSCPAIIADMPRLTLRFLSSSGSTLARAQVNVYPGRDGASGWNGCDPIDFWIGAKEQTPLTSETFVRKIAGLIGANIS